MLKDDVLVTLDDDVVVKRGRASYTAPKGGRYSRFCESERGRVGFNTQQNTFSP